MKEFKHPLSHYSERPTGSIVDTIVVHSIYAEGSEDPLSPALCIAALDLHQVSAHYLITQGGEIYKLVGEEFKAWHAGQSQMRFCDNARTEVNDFSIGIELIAAPGAGFTRKEYEALSDLIADISFRHPIRYIVGHEDIAPSRKTDPGVGFDWENLRKLLGERISSAHTFRFRREE